MKIENMAVLRGKLEQLETRQLEDMLLTELRAESPDGDLIRLIGGILRERDRNDPPEIDDSIRAAWERYQEQSRPLHKKPKIRNTILFKAAAVLLVVLTLAAIVPQKAEAVSLFQRFMAWTEDVFSLANPAEEAPSGKDYVFRTDHPGLQEVYDQVTALGITVPVVPSWLPEGYELMECKVTETPTSNYLTARFLSANKELVFHASFFSDNLTHEFYKDGTEILVIEKNGIKHTILQNEDVMVAVWTVDNIQCSIFIDCQEDVLLRILDAIYTMEVT